MERRYVFHPQEFAIDETERFYTKMAGSGWRLVKRGAYLSSFRRWAPEKIRYGIVLTVPARPGEPPFTEEQMDAYKASGWEYVTGRGFIHVFSASGNGGASEPYQEPKSYADARKGLKKQYMVSFLQLPLSIAFFLLLGYMLGGYGGYSRLLSSAYRGWIENTAAVTGFIFFLLCLMYRDVRGIWYLGHLRRRMKDGERSEYLPVSGFRVSTFLNVSLMLITAVFGVLAICQWAGSYRHAMPAEADGPYLVLSDIGVKGERTQSFIKNQVSEVKYGCSLLTEHWNTFEVVDADGSEVWMRQDVYHLKDAGMRGNVVGLLMEDAVFAGSPEDFVLTDIPGLDQAWVSERLECIAVRDDYVWYLTYPAHSREDLAFVLQALAGTI